MTAQESGSGFQPPLHAREYLAEALQLDLVGPDPEHPLADDRFPGWVRPSNWYLTGFLIPSWTPPERRTDADEEDDFELVPEVAGLTEESTEKRKAAKKGYFPSSMGLSLLVPQAVDLLEVTVRWGDYTPGELGDGEGGPLHGSAARACSH